MEKMDCPLVGVIILHWGSLENTLECIESVSNSGYKKTIIILVDNYPEDRIDQSILKDKNKIYYLEAPTNLGYCEGNNAGIKKAKKFGAEYILLLNNDTIIDKVMIGLSVKYMKENEDVAVISPKIYFYKEPKIINIAGGEIDINTGNISYIGWNEEDKGQYDNVRRITWVQGCAIFARTELFTKIGMFNEKLFCYGEDVDISRRIILGGMKIIYYPKAKVWHKCESLEVNSRGMLQTPLSAYYIWRNRLYNLKRYMKKGYIKGYCLYCFAFIRRLAAFSLKHRKSNISKAMIFGIIDGLLDRMGKREYKCFWKG